MNSKIILTLLTMLYSFMATAQSHIDTSMLSNKEIRQNVDITPKQALNIYTKRYQDVISKKNINVQYELAKYLASAHYRVGDTENVPIWQSRVDSLAKYLDEVPYDRSYEFHKITLAIAGEKDMLAIELLEIMKPKALSSNDTVWMINWHNKMIGAHTDLSDRANALKYLLEAEKLSSEYNNDRQKALLLKARAVIQWEERELDLALENFLASAKIYERLRGYDMLLPIYRNIVTTAIEVDKQNIALEYSEKLSKLQKTRGSQIGYYTGEENRIYHLIQFGKYKQAVTLAEKTIAYADSTKRNPAHATYLMGVAYRGLNEYSKAETLIQRAFDLAKDTRQIGGCTFYSHALYQTFYWKDKFGDALNWYKIHVTYKDSVRNEKKLKEIAVFESKLEALDQKRKVEVLEAKSETDKQKRNLLLITIILGSLLGLATLYSQRQRSKKQRAIQEAKLIQSNMEREKLEQKLEYKQKELAGQILYMTQKNILLQDVSYGISELKNTENGHVISRLIRSINKSIDNSEEWDQFLNTFKSIHSSFLNELKSLSDALTSNEIRLASLMKMNLSNKEIASMLNISQDGVKKARYRLRKKLKLESNINIQDYLLGM